METALWHCVCHSLLAVFIIEWVRWIIDEATGRQCAALPHWPSYSHRGVHAHSRRCVCINTSSQKRTHTCVRIAFVAFCPATNHSEAYHTHAHSPIGMVHSVSWVMSSQGKWISSSIQRSKALGLDFTMGWDSIFSLQSFFLNLNLFNVSIIMSSCVRLIDCWLP